MLAAFASDPALELRTSRVTPAATPTPPATKPMIDIVVALLASLSSWFTSSLLSTGHWLFGGTLQISLASVRLLLAFSKKTVPRPRPIAPTPNAAYEPMRIVERESEPVSAEAEDAVAAVDVDPSPAVPLPGSAVAAAVVGGLGCAVVFVSASSLSATDVFSPSPTRTVCGRERSPV